MQENVLGLTGVACHHLEASSSQNFHLSTCASGFLALLMTTAATAATAPFESNAFSWIFVGNRASLTDLAVGRRASYPSCGTLGFLAEWVVDAQATIPYNKTSTA